jgi:hypothetical protein
MKMKTGWIIAIVVVLVLLLPGAFIVGQWLGGGFGYRGMMDERGIMPWGFNTMHPFGGGLMFLGWLIPLGLLVLVVIGIVLLVNALSRPKQPVTPVAPVALEHKCAQCGKPLQAEWTVCAYCGTPVTAPAERKCAMCGRPAQADWTTCPYCGNPLT